MVGVRADGKLETPKTEAKGKRSKPSAHANAVVASTVVCANCGAGHYISACPDFASKKPDQRREIAISKKLCFNCLGSHRIKDCRTTKRCRSCGGHHHTLIHPSSSGQASGTSASSGTESSDSTTPSTSAAVANHASSASVEGRALTLLATARVRVETESGSEVEVRALLDQGSELSFVSESLAQILRIPRQRASVSVLGMGATRVGSTRGMLALRLRSCLDSNGEVQCVAYILPRLTGVVPSQPVVDGSWPHVRKLPLADPDFAKPNKIDLVLGADVYAIILRAGVRRGNADAPIAQETSLGWIVSGPIGHAPHSSESLRRQSFATSNEEDLQHLITRFWNQEEIPAADSPALNDNEQQCEAHFSATCQRDRSGRYVVRLPFRRSPTQLGPSYSGAAQVLLRLQRRFISNPRLQGLYSQFLQEYETLGHMIAAPRGPRESVFLPHHGVIRESSTTTKLRVVFNGSWRTSTGLSLNDCLHVGPKLQPALADVLLRWRRHEFVFLADIEKMYRQVRVHQDDQDYQRILWNVDGSPVEYRLTTVTYGLACAPYLALRVIQQLAQDEGHRHPLAVDVLSREMYVDDVLSGADSVAQARTKAHQVDDLLTAGGFRLTKWTANVDAILSNLEPDRRGAVSIRDLDSDVSARALGLSSRPSSDSFAFECRLSPSGGAVTKRSILSRTAQLFDPLGWIAPVIISAKIMMQQLWQSGVGWDDELPMSIVSRWTAFERDLVVVADYSIPRWLGLKNDVLGVEIHGFSDASQAALGAVLYLRVLNSELDDVRVSLIVAKSKVAPLRKQTIPRLELSAAVLLARLAKWTVATLSLTLVPIHLWVDSSVVLAWIRGHPSRWKEFVANRVAAIHDLVPSARWHHVAGADNPADHASRGLLPSELSKTDVWWRGPAWLSHSSPSWPSAVPPLATGTNLEERRVAPALAVTRDSESIPVWELINRYSELRRLLRVTAWVRRAVHRFRRSISEDARGVLSPSEINSAELFWIKLTQTAHFSDELRALSRGSDLPRSHPLLRLTPFLDNQGVMRVGGRLRNSLLDSDMKHPIVLPRGATLTTLVLRDIHRRTLHGGVQVMLATLRRKYWNVGGRGPVSAFVRRCVRCVRYRAATAREMMGQLPTSRVTRSRPFLNSGVDYAGPFELKTWKGRAARRYKSFIILFVCLSTSAVHIEVATDYTTQGFLAAYKRFTSRRGICASLTSDCGTNLVGADAELRRLFSNTSQELAALQQVIASDGTEWKFNPPAAPHFGGKWEAAVKSVKFHVRRVIGDTCLTYEEFGTFLSQVEAVLNSRPLCAISEDPGDLEALTPAHFLIGEALTTIPEPSLIETETTRLSRWQHLRQLLERFWLRWSSEYLQRLQDISKWQRPSRAVTVGSIVLLADERYPPSKWPLARIIEAHPGRDGLIRVVTVRTATTTLKRPIVKVCLLPA